MFKSVLEIKVEEIKVEEAEWNEISGKCFSHTLLRPGAG